MYDFSGLWYCVYRVWYEARTDIIVKCEKVQ